MSSQITMPNQSMKDALNGTGTNRSVSDVPQDGCSMVKENVPQFQYNAENTTDSGPACLATKDMS